MLPSAEIAKTYDRKDQNKPLSRLLETMLSTFKNINAINRRDTQGGTRRFLVFKHKYVTTESPATAKCK